MKKSLLTLAIACALVIGSVSCSKKDAGADSASALTSKIENCTNPDSIGMYVEQAKAYAEKLVKEGKIDEAKAYLDKIEPVVKKKAPALESTLTAVNSALGKVSDTVSDKASDAKEAVDSLGEAASDAADKAKQTLSDKAEDAKQTVSDKADQAKQAVSDKADQVKDLLK